MGEEMDRGAERWRQYLKTANISHDAWREGAEYGAKVGLVIGALVTLGLLILIKVTA